MYVELHTITKVICDKKMTAYEQKVGPEQLSD